MASLLLLWSLIGCVAFYQHVTFDPHTAMSASAWERQFHQELPVWFSYDFAIAVGAALWGSVAMLRRSRMANILYIVSLAAVVVQFGYMLGFTGVIGEKGLLKAAAIPVSTLAIGAFQIWLAGFATRRGWIL